MEYLANDRTTKRRHAASAKPLRQRMAGALALVDEEVDSGMVRRIREIAADALPAPGTERVRKGIVPEFAPEDPHQISWPADRQLVEVSDRLAALKHFGMECERRGDHFHSGEVAFQIQEIINQTNTLYETRQRLLKKHL